MDMMGSGTTITTSGPTSGPTSGRQTATNTSGRQQPPSNSKSLYRPDVDGLRGFGAALVIWFH